MAAGDDAAAAGMDVVPGTAPANTIDTLINITRDYIAQRTSAVTPVNKGGTGSTTAAAARTALGAAAAANVYAKSEIDFAFGVRDTAIDQVEAGLFGPGPYDRNITWTRRAAWLGDGNQLGYASSTRASKQDITPADLDLAALRAIPIVLYRYRAEVAKELEQPGYRAAVEIGTLADDLHELGLWQFVVYEGRGADARPVSVHYELLGLAALAYAQQLHARVELLEQRLDAIERGDA